MWPLLNSRSGSTSTIWPPASMSSRSVWRLMSVTMWHLPFNSLLHHGGFIISVHFGCRIVHDGAPHFCCLCGNRRRRHDVSFESFSRHPHLSVAPGGEEVDERTPVFDNIAPVVSAEYEEGCPAVWFALDEIDLYRSVGLRIC